MHVWSKDEFLEEATRIGGRKFAEYHKAFLAALERAGVPATFDGAGKKQATYTIRVAPEADWHIVRVWANGRVILMLNHLRDYVAPSAAVGAQESFSHHLRSDATKCPKVAGNVDEFEVMDPDGVARAVRDVANSVR